MSIHGNLADLPLVDLLQFVHLSGRSGTLHLERDDGRAHISLHRGRIASAWCPTSLRVTDLLIEAGVLTQEAVEEAIAIQEREQPRRGLGPILVSMSAVSDQALRAAVARKIEHTITELVRWTHGAFHFAVDTVFCDDDLAFAPGDVVPLVDLNTQMVLMEAVRVFDERNRLGPAEAPVLAPVVALQAPARPAAPAGAGASAGTAAAAAAAAARAAAPARIRVQVASSDGELAGRLALVLAGTAKVARVALRDAGAPAPGEQPPIVVVSLVERIAVSTIATIVRSHPRSLVIALVPPEQPAAPVYAAGAVAVLPPDPHAVAACCTSLLASRGQLPVTPDVTEAGLARLRRVLGDIRSGLLSATLALNLMTIVADSVERAVLFVVQRNLLTAIGAFGVRRDGKPLADLTRGLTVPLTGATLFAECALDGRARTRAYEQAQLPAELTAVLDRPRSGQVVLFPVLGARRAIALIYTDNGRRERAIDDVEIVELATAHVGLAFENELLRRHAAIAAPSAGAVVAEARKGER